MNSPTEPDLPPTPDVLKQEARIWLRRLSAGEATEWDAEAFRRWRATSRAHAQAFDEAKRQWQALGPAMGLLLQKDQAAADHHARAMQGRGNSRRLFLRVGGAALAGAAGVAIVRPPLHLWPSWEEWQADARTARGEQRQLALGQDVLVTLNTESSLRRDAMQDGAYRLALIAGEAAVDLGGSAAPLSLQAGAGRVTSQAGQFEVRKRDGEVCVSCLRGAVMVMHPSGQVPLTARQQLTYDDTRLGAVGAVDTEAASAWRRGELVFRQTPLRDVIAEINRYRPGRVVLVASDAGSRAVNGRFALAALDSALLQLQHSFQLDMRRLPGGVMVLS